ncbi:MAG: response regulator [Methylacidiphilales bacterium]|nr:response regulator [Candidatus Methylacidiphilales bacterium]
MGEAEDSGFVSKEELAHLLRELKQLHDERLEIKKVETLFKLVTDNIADLIAVVSPTGLRLWNNSAYQKTLGYDPEAMEGSYSLAEVHPDDMAMVQSVFEESIRTGMGRKIEYRIRHAKGDWVLLESVARVVANEKGDVECLVLVSRDITMRKKMEEELIKAKKIEAVSNLATGVGHEFDSILKNVVEHIRKARKNSAQKGRDFAADLEQAETAAMQAQQVVNRLMGLGGETDEVEKKELMVGPLLRGISEAVLANTLARCDLFIAPGIPSILVEQQGFIQALKNILTNSVESITSRSVIRITADVATFSLNSVNRPPQLAPGAYVNIEIRDQGKGIEQEHLARAFEPYFTTKEKAQGMGLTTALSIISRHKGTILIDSKPRVGTVVKIYIPVHGPVQARETVAAPQAAGREKRILLMDDEELVRNFIGTMLKQLGYQVMTAKDGGEAIRIYEEAIAMGQKFNAVILDLMVPNGMGGAEVIHSLRQIDPEVLAIASSGYTDQPAMMDPQPFGFTAVIAKPFNRDRLREVLSRVL